jgi:hypothetical protein
MKKALLALATIAVLAVASMAPTPADARCRGCGVGLGILGGVVIGSAIANAYPRSYYPVAGYQPYPAYYQPAPYGCPGGYWARRPVVDRFGNVVGYSRARFFCPAY